MENLLHIALVQTTVSRNVEENLENSAKWIGQAAQKGADLVVFPEMFMALPAKDVELGKVAQPLDGPFVQGLAKLAADHGVGVVCGIWEKLAADEKKAANVAVVLDRNGDLLARYNKVHLFDALSVRESDTMTGGNAAPPVFCINGVNLGLAICYDLRFPELFRYLAVNGADGVIVPSAWYAGPLKEEHWLTLLRARAIENTMYVCGANLCGTPFSARSAIFDPFGVAAAEAGEGEALVLGTIEQSRIGDVRTRLPSLSHVRKDLFIG
ncbi:carbon-nitrogen hydrolase family protein [Desulforhopalus singaporensis]|uniref:Predicted amidohydrolase n=1 Tax=Desulforhopalus singaporensis TaxID=91360 RepID=A0A1H0LKB4_9BACT|nr:carbon-nitrogen hydrolase family protein [Desulforhopalus singaporensis]SDO68411.1 Predicted amidohydrolase [Desulforhopalus singaporensis]